MELASRHKDFAVKKSLSSVEENHEWTSAKTSKAPSTQKNFLTRSQSFTESLNQSIVQYLLSYSIDWIIATILILIGFIKTLHLNSRLGKSLTTICIRVGMGFSVLHITLIERHYIFAICDVVCDIYLAAS